MRILDTVHNEAEAEAAVSKYGFPLLMRRVTDDLHAAAHDSDGLKKAVAVLFSGGDTKTWLVAA